MDSAEAARDWLCNPQAQVSAHYVVGRDGFVWQLVCEGQRAWHAGAGAWGDVTDINSRSIGIEIANDGFQPFPEPQMQAVEALITGTMARWQVPAERVLGHSDTTPGRKVDPGRRFDWRRLATGGRAIWPENRPENRPENCPEGDADGAGGDFWSDARRFGYRWQPGCEDAVLDTVRQRFRPAARGPLTAQDRALMAQLANRWPVAWG